MRAKPNIASKSPQAALIHSRIPPPDFRAIDLPLDLNFGRRSTVLRFLRPDDEARLIEFFESHAPETIHDRYGFSLHMSHEHAARLVGVDQVRDAAIGVFEQSPVASLIAVGRYCLADDGKSAELAFVVREDRRRLGIATTLMKLLVAIAHERGLLRLTAQVNADNFRMLALFRQFGANFADIPKSETVKVNLDLGR